MAGQRKSIILHVGCRKSGTSYLQAGLSGSLESLRSQGLNLPFPGRGGHMDKILLPVRETLQTGDPGPADRGLGVLLRRVANSGQPRHLVTLEDLAELPDAGARLILDTLAAHHDVTVVITARHWGVTIPSEWQQCMKSRMTIGYTDFLAEIRNDGPAADFYRDRQDLGRLVTRWGAERADVRTVVIAVPDGRSTVLLDEFCALIQVDPDSLSMPPGNINQSLSYGQAEMLRRLNLALGDRLTDLRKEYRVAVREPLTQASLMREQNRTKVTLPPEYAPWVHEQSLRQLEAVRTEGVDLRGVPEALVSPPVMDVPAPSITDAEIADIAVKVLADLAVRRHHEITQAEQG